jgi:hypothetical protein
MDPLSALSLATSIVQFVDFATKIVHGARQIYQTGESATAENADIELCASSTIFALVSKSQNYPTQEAPTTMPCAASQTVA